MVKPRSLDEIAFRSFERSLAYGYIIFTLLYCSNGLAERFFNVTFVNVDSMFGLSGAYAMAHSFFTYDATPETFRLKKFLIAGSLFTLIAAIVLLADGALFTIKGSILLGEAAIVSFGGALLVRVICKAIWYRISGRYYD